MDKNKNLCTCAMTIEVIVAFLDERDGDGMQMVDIYSKQGNLLAHVPYSYVSNSVEEKRGSTERQCFLIGQLMKQEENRNSPPKKVFSKSEGRWIKKE